MKDILTGEHVRKPYLFLGNLSEELDPVDKSALKSRSRDVKSRSRGCARPQPSARKLCADAELELGAAPGSLALLGAGEAPPGGPRSLAESPEHSCQAGGDVEAPRAYGGSVDVSDASRPSGPHAALASGFPKGLSLLP